MTRRPRTHPHSDFLQMATVVPEGRHGEARVEHFTVTEDDAKRYNFGLMFTAGAGLEHVSPGRYARLGVGNTLMMSDTPMERTTNWEFVHHANGRVLIAGLGLGLIVHPVIKKVDHITILEKSADVIALVAPTLARYRRKVEIIEADAFEWPLPPGAKWDTIYGDIWPGVTEDNLPEMARLSRRFARRLNRANPRAWMGHWRQKNLQARAREGRQYFWR